MNRTGRVSDRLLSMVLSVLVYATSSSVAEDAAETAGVTREVIPCATAHYSFGTAVTTNGLVLFTEFNRRQIRSWSPQTRRLEVWRAAKTPGMFGVATGTAGDVFVGMDLGDKGNPGKVLRIRADGQEEFIVENITRPRQLTCDRAGNLYVVLEGGNILRWDKATRAVTEIMTALSPVSGIAVGRDGSVYISEYGVFDVAPEGYSRPSSPGQVKVKRPNGEIVILAKGFWRARGLALHDRTLYLCSESNRDDHGNAGQLVRIDAMTGAQEILLDRLDYPQFAAVNGTGTVYFTLARDNSLVAYDPAALFRNSSSPPDAVTRLSLRGGSVTWDKAPSGIPFTIRAQSLSLSGSLQPGRGATRMDGWLEVPSARFQLNPDALYPRHDAEHPSPGLFELPSVKSSCGTGELHVDVFPLRRHQGSRWPMQHVGTAQESPALGFSEQPEAFRIYFAWTAAPSELRVIAGWTVHIRRELLAQESRLTERALELLQKQLEEIARVVPAQALAELWKVPLYVSPEYAGVKPRAEFHPGAGWLRDNGRDPAMAKGVEFTNVRIFEQEMNRMPNFALHELAHAYHDRFLPQGFSNPGVKAAYEKARAGGKYDWVERWHGNGKPNTFERAYAMTNPQEFFAENTEAFFSRNDYFPFTQNELKRHDPDMFELLGKLWNLRPEEQGTTPKP